MLFVFYKTWLYLQFELQNFVEYDNMYTVIS